MFMKPRKNRGFFYLPTQPKNSFALKGPTEWFRLIFLVDYMFLWFKKKKIIDLTSLYVYLQHI